MGGRDAKATGHAEQRGRDCAAWRDLDVVRRIVLTAEHAAEPSPHGLHKLKLGFEEGAIPRVGGVEPCAVPLEPVAAPAGEEAGRALQNVTLG